MAAKNNRTGETMNDAGTDGISTLPHIVVLGAGFGGLAFAKRFPNGPAGRAR